MSSEAPRAAIEDYQARNLGRLAPLVGRRVFNCGAPAILEDDVLYPVVGALDRGRYQQYRFLVGLLEQSDAYAVHLFPPPDHTLGKPFFEGEPETHPRLQFGAADERQYAGYTALIATVDVQTVNYVNTLRLEGRLPDDEPVPIPFNSGAASSLAEGIVLSLAAKV